MGQLDPSSVRIFSGVIAEEPDAAEQLFHRYLQRLCRLVRTRMASRLAQRVDAEDVVMSAYRSFFLSARTGRFRIQEAGELWALLTTITLRKLYRSAAHHTAEMRSMRREVPIDESADQHTWFISEQPSAEEAVGLADEVEAVLASLPQEHRRILELRLQGELLDDIARDVGLSERTIRRVLAEIEDGLRRKHEIPTAESISVIASSSPSPMPRTTPDRSGQLPDPSDGRIRFEDLLLKRMIGAGGMGKVYRALMRATAEPLAVKFLHKTFQDDPAMVERFRNEAEIVQRLSHRGIVRVEGVGRTRAGVYFIVMELIQGRNLAEFIAERLPSVAEAVRWITQVADAIQCAHEAGIAHCDLKPSNVILTDSGDAVVTDFGLARRIGDSDSCADLIAGTAPWMAPEQVDPVFGPIGPLTDVYGLGALFYTMLTGQPPFSGSRVADVLARVARDSPTAPTVVRPEIPDELANLCLTCLSRIPSARPGSAATFRDAVRHFAPSNDG